MSKVEMLLREAGLTSTETQAVVICIARTREERTRLAHAFDGVGVLVMASDADSAQAFLATFRPSELAPVISVGGLRLEPAHREATWHGRPLWLTAHELKVLACLASSPGRAWTHRQLHDAAWDGSYFTGPQALRSVIKRLRAKLRERDVPLHIHTVRGLGFTLEAIGDLQLVR